MDTRQLRLPRVWGFRFRLELLKHAWRPHARDKTLRWHLLFYRRQRLLWPQGHRPNDMQLSERLRLPGHGWMELNEAMLRLE